MSNAAIVPVGITVMLVGPYVCYTAAAKRPDFGQGADRSRLPDVPDDLEGVVEHHARLRRHDGSCGSIYGLRPIFPKTLRRRQRLHDGLPESVFFHDWLTHCPLMVLTVIAVPLINTLSGEAPRF